MPTEEENKALHNALFGVYNNTNEEEHIDEAPEAEEESVETEVETATPSYRFKTKVDGQEEEKDYSETDIISGLQMKSKFDKEMSKLDLEKQSLRKEREELATQLGQYSDLFKMGQAFKQIEKSNPKLYKQVLGSLSGEEVEVQEIEDDFGKQLDSHLRKFDAEDYRDVPILKESATLLQKMYLELKKNQSELSKNLGQKLSQVETTSDIYLKEKEMREQEAHKARIEKDFSRLQGWFKEREIPLDPDSKQFQMIDMAYRNGNDPIAVAEMLYPNTQKAPAQEAEVEEVTPVRQAVKKGRAERDGEKNALTNALFFGRAKSIADI